MRMYKDFQHLSIQQLVRSDDPNCYDANQAHLFEYLMNDYDDPLSNSKFIELIKNTNLNLSHPSIQHNLMKNWVKKFSRHLALGNENIFYIFRHIDWNAVIPITDNYSGEKIIFFNSIGRYSSDDKISWLHFALLENWKLALQGLTHSKDKKEMINFKNTANENVFHVMVKSFLSSPKPYSEILKLIRTILMYYEQKINSKDRDNRTPVDILRLFLTSEKYPKLHEDFIAMVNLINKVDLEMFLNNKFYNIPGRPKPKVFV